MQRNPITLHDIRSILNHLRYDGLASILRRLCPSRSTRVEHAWAATDTPPESWSDIPQVRKRWNRMISGDADIDHRTYIADKYLPGCDFLTALSLGCGTGQKEVAWASTGRFDCIDAYDISAPRIAAAERHAAARGFDHLLNFRRDDVFEVDFGRGTYDVIVAEHALHHFSPLEELLDRICHALRDDGIFVVNEFVGPTRFQWTERQLDAANGLLSLLPEACRTRGNRQPKRRVGRPGWFSMWLYDPSEAVESAEILPLLQRHFNVAEVRPYGGALLHPLMSGIAQNFLRDDSQIERALDLCFEAEDLLMESGDLESDFVVAVCRDPSASP